MYLNPPRISNRLKTLQAKQSPAFGIKKHNAIFPPGCQPPKVSRSEGSKIAVKIQIKDTTIVATYAVNKNGQNLAFDFSIQLNYVRFVKKVDKKNPICILERT